MKFLAPSILLLAIFIPLKADEELKNPDFTNGRSHWQGDGVAAAERNTDANPLAQTDSSQNGGLVIKLSRRDWTRVSQDFRPLNANGVLTVVYKFSDNLAFSTDPDDYKNVPQKMNFGAFKPFDIKAGNWIALFIETARFEMDYYNITPLASSDTQTYKGDISGLVPRVDKTICLAFPPGVGTITLLHVGLSGN
jgi:hypothetical protein